MGRIVQTCFCILWIVVVAHSEGLSSQPVESQIEANSQSRSAEIAELISGINLQPKETGVELEADPTSVIHTGDKDVAMSAPGQEEPTPDDSRINGGQEVKQVVPYQISMQLHRRGKWNHFCGGSIIGPHHVLTAAHCVVNMKPEEVSIVSGTLNWKKGGTRHRIVAKRMHPKFSMNPKIINDIAVLKVTPPFNLHSPQVGAIHLGGQGRVGERVPVKLTGWGATTPTASKGLPETLQKLQYRTISNEECGRKGFKVTPNEICALAAKGKGACVGDSGGPLVTPHGIPQLVGIVSYGTATCAKGRPDVYTRVSSFLPYINRVITQEIP